METYLKIQKKHFKSIPKKLKKVFKFNTIQAHKLLEISQYCLISFFVALFCSTGINRMMIEDRKRLRSIETLSLTLKISGYTLLIAILAKYIPKIVSIIPFLGHWSRKYKSNFKGESYYGNSVSMGFAFYGVIYNFYAMIEELTFRIFPNSQKLTGPATQMCKDDDGNYIQAHPSCETVKQQQVYHKVD